MKNQSEFIEKALERIDYLIKENEKKIKELDKKIDKTKDYVLQSQLIGISNQLRNEQTDLYFIKVTLDPNLPF